MNKLKILTRPISQTRFLCSSSSSSSSSFTIKNVTKSNFEAALTDLRGHVRGADFVAIDLEMSGVTSTPWRESLDFDRFDIQYLKVKDSAEKFAVLQFGVCPFRWDPVKLSFIAHPYNFYIFPRQEIAGGQSPEFLCQTSSIDFLSRYQFDFNLCIREGISYLSRSQEEEALRGLYSRYKYGSPKLGHMKEPTDTKLERMSDILFSERMKNKVRNWRDSLLQDRGIRSECQPSSNNSNQNCQTTFFKSRPALVLDGFSSHQLHLIKMVTKKITDLEYICVPADTCCSQHLIVYTDSANDRELLRREVVDCLRDEATVKIKAASGFRRVIDLLCTEQKLIVGHHCFLDIAHVYNKFIGPLPLTAAEYAARVQEYFPYIIDTKVLLNTSNVFQHTVNKSNTSLSKAFSLFCPQIASGVISSTLADNLWVKVEVQVDDKRSSNWNSGAKHEAGYDAFMTGCVFAQACSHLDVEFSLPHQPVDLANNEKLQKYVNHLYLSWKSGDIMNLQTGKISEEYFGSNNHQGRSSKVLFTNIVLLWGFPRHLKANEIRECLSKVLGPTSVTSIYHIDVSAVFIQFSKEELVPDFLELIETLKRTNGPISILHPLSKILEGGSTQAGNYEAYKEICSSPVSKVLFADQAVAVCVDWKARLVKASTDQIDLKDSECIGNIEDKEGAFSVDQAGDSVDLNYPVEAQLSK